MRKSKVCLRAFQFLGLILVLIIGLGTTTIVEASDDYIGKANVVKSNTDWFGDMSVSGTRTQGTSVTVKIQTKRQSNYYRPDTEKSANIKLIVNGKEGKPYDLGKPYYGYGDSITKSGITIPEGVKEFNIRITDEGFRPDAYKEYGPFTSKPKPTSSSTSSPSNQEPSKSNSSSTQSPSTPSSSRTAEAFGNFWVTAERNSGDKNYSGAGNKFYVGDRIHASAKLSSSAATAAGNGTSRFRWVIEVNGKQVDQGETTTGVKNHITTSKYTLNETGRVNVRFWCEKLGTNYNWKYGKSEWSNNIISSVSGGNSSQQNSNATTNPTVSITEAGFTLGNTDNPTTIQTGKSLYAYIKTTDLGNKSFRANYVYSYKFLDSNGKVISEKSNHKTTNTVTVKNGKGSVYIGYISSKCAKIEATVIFTVITNNQSIKINGADTITKDLKL